MATRRTRTPHGAGRHDRRPGLNAALVLALVAVGCGGAQEGTAVSGSVDPGGVVASDDARPTDPDRSDDTPTPPDPTDDSDVGGAAASPVLAVDGLPVTARFGGVELDVRSITVEPDDDDAGDDATVVVDVVATNTTTGTPLSIKRELFQLVTPDDRRLGGARFTEAAQTVHLEGGESADEQVRFPVDPSFDLAGHALRIGADDAIPTVVDFDTVTVAPGDEWPVRVEATGSGPAQGNVRGCGQEWDITVDGGEVRLDLGLDGYGGRGQFPQTRRAPEGERWLVLDGNLFNRGGELCGGGRTNYQEQAFRLSWSDGRERSADLVSPPNVAIDPDDDLDLSWAWLVPAEERAVTLLVGSAEETLFTLEVTLPNLPPVAPEGATG